MVKCPLEKAKELCNLQLSLKRNLTTTLVIHFDLAFECKLGDMTRFETLQINKRGSCTSIVIQNPEFKNKGKKYKTLGKNQVWSEHVS